VSASRSVQDLDPVAIPRAQARGAHAPIVVDLDALKLASFSVPRRRAAAHEALPEREPTFDELLHGSSAHATMSGGARPRGGRWFRPRRAARAKDPRAKGPGARAARGRTPRVEAPTGKARAGGAVR
jgi:hypothetical protein